MNATETEVNWNTFTIGFSSPNNQARDLIRNRPTHGLTADALAGELTTALNHFLGKSIRVTADGRIFLSENAQQALTATEASREVFRAYGKVAEISRKNYETSNSIQGMFNLV